MKYFLTILTFLFCFLTINAIEFSEEELKTHHIIAGIFSTEKLCSFIEKGDLIRHENHPYYINNTAICVSYISLINQFKDKPPLVILCGEEQIFDLSDTEKEKLQSTLTSKSIGIRDNMCMETNTIITISDTNLPCPDGVDLFATVIFITNATINTGLDTTIRGTDVTITDSTLTLQGTNFITTNLTITNSNINCFDLQMEANNIATIGIANSFSVQLDININCTNCPSLSISAPYLDANNLYIQGQVIDYMVIITSITDTMQIIAIDSTTITGDILSAAYFEATFLGNSANFDFEYNESTITDSFTLDISGQNNNVIIGPLSMFGSNSFSITDQNTPFSSMITFQQIFSFNVVDTFFVEGAQIFIQDSGQDITAATFQILSYGTIDIRNVNNLQISGSILLISDVVSVGDIIFDSIGSITSGNFEIYSDGNVLLNEVDIIDISNSMFIRCSGTFRIIMLQQIQSLTITDEFRILTSTDPVKSNRVYFLFVYTIEVNKFLVETDSSSATGGGIIQISNSETINCATSWIITTDCIDCDIILEYINDFSTFSLDLTAPDSLIMLRDWISNDIDNFYSTSQTIEIYNSELRSSAIVSINLESNVGQSIISDSFIVLTQSVDISNLFSSSLLIERTEISSSFNDITINGELITIEDSTFLASNDLNIITRATFISYNSDYSTDIGTINLDGNLMLLEGQFQAASSIDFVNYDSIELCTYASGETISFANGTGTTIDCNYNLYTQLTYITIIACTNSFSHYDINGDSIRDLQISANSFESYGSFTNIGQLSIIVQTINSYIPLHTFHANDISMDTTSGVNKLRVLSTASSNTFLIEANQVNIYCEVTCNIPGTLNGNFEFFDDFSSPQLTYGEQGTFSTSSLIDNLVFPNNSYSTLFAVVDRNITPYNINNFQIADNNSIINPKPVAIGTEYTNLLSIYDLLFISTSWTLRIEIPDIQTYGSLSVNNLMFSDLPTNPKIIIDIQDYSGYPYEKNVIPKATFYVFICNQQSNFDSLEFIDIHTGNPVLNNDYIQGSSGIFYRVTYNALSASGYNSFSFENILVQPSTFTATPTSSSTLTSTPTSSPTSSSSASNTPTSSPSNSETSTTTKTMTPTPTPTSTASQVTFTASPVPSESQSTTFSSSATPTPTSSKTSTQTSTPTLTESSTSTSTKSISMSPTARFSPSTTITASQTKTLTAIPTTSTTSTLTSTPSLTSTQTLSATPSFTPTSTPTSTKSASNTKSSNQTETATISSTPTNVVIVQSSNSSTISPGESLSSTFTPTSTKTVLVNDIAPPLSLSRSPIPELKTNSPTKSKMAQAESSTDNFQNPSPSPNVIPTAASFECSSCEFGSTKTVIAGGGDSRNINGNNNGSGNNNNSGNSNNNGGGGGNIEVPFSSNNGDTVGGIYFPPETFNSDSENTIEINLVSNIQGQEVQNSNGDNVKLGNTIVDVVILDQFGNQVTKFSEPLTICLESSDSNEDECLGYYDTEKKEWICEDDCPEKEDGGLVCGKTDHLTSFALLLNGKNSDCTGDDSQHLYVYLSIAFVGVGIIAVLISIVVIELHYCNQRRIRSAEFGRLIQHGNTVV